VPLSLQSLARRKRPAGFKVGCSGSRKRLPLGRSSPFGRFATANYRAMPKSATCRFSGQHRAFAVGSG